MLVLDCSAAVSIVMNNKEGRAMMGLMEKDEKVISSPLFIAEMDSALGKYVQAGLISLDLAHSYLTNSIELIDEFIDMQDICIEALDESIRNNHSSYDMFYLVIARRNGATLLTLDKKLESLARKLKIDCIHRVNL